MLTVDDVSCTQVISIDGFTRRTRFILAVSIGLGLGVTLVPGCPRPLLPSPKPAYMSACACTPSIFDFANLLDDLTRLRSELG